MILKRMEAEANNFEKPQEMMENWDQGTAFRRGSAGHCVTSEAFKIPGPN